MPWSVCPALPGPSQCGVPICVSIRVGLNVYASCVCACACAGVRQCVCLCVSIETVTAVVNVVLPCTFCRTVG